MDNDKMKEYWNGYRYAKNLAYDYGIDEVRYQWNYGLQGKSDMFCKGFKRYLQPIKK